jgi:hypothetical protein
MHLRPPTPTRVVIRHGPFQCTKPLTLCQAFLSTFSHVCSFRLVGSNPPGALFAILVVAAILLGNVLYQIPKGQPAAWCFFSIFFCTALTLKAFRDLDKINKSPMSSVHEKVLIHSGSIGEEPLVYTLEEKAKKERFDGFKDSRERMATTMRKRRRTRDEYTYVCRKIAC